MIAAMKSKIALAISLLGCGTIFAAAKPEISWSIMHPTGINVEYMKLVAAKAAEYGGVDSFEVCGDCHSPYGGINGLSMLEPYPKSHAGVDPKAVEKARRELNDIVAIAHSVGKPLYYWHREIFIPKGLLEDLPLLLDEDGEFDLLGKTYQDYLRFKISEAFKYVPDLDGIALTLTEADFSVIHNSNPERYPPPKVVEALVRIFAEEHAKRGKRFILRSFGSIRKDYEDIIAGAVAAARDHAFEIETKVTEADFVPWLPKNPFLKKNPPLTLGAECDALGEYLGAGYLPAAQVERIREYVESAREEDVDRYTIRIDRVGNSIFDSAHEINLYAYMRFIRDPEVTSEQIYAEYAKKHYGAAAEAMAALEKSELEMVRNIHYVASNLVFHAFPLKSNITTLKACGIFGLYRENADLSMSSGSWSILHWHKAPTHERILKEKRDGLKSAEEGLAKVRSLKGVLSEYEYVRIERAWQAAVVAGKALEAYTKCVVAYFEDMRDNQDEPQRLRKAVKDGVATIESLMTNVNDFYPGGREYFNVCGRNLDRVYCIGLRYSCQALLKEYDAERKERRELAARSGMLDFVVVGGIYDDGRVLRPMHGAKSVTRDGRVMRKVGNPVFPNGTITVKFRDVPGAKVEIALDPSGSQEYSCTETLEDGFRKVVIGKKGADYPAVVSVALVKSALHVIHRGWGIEWPENSLAALERCWQAGFIPEIDGRMSQDGVCFAFHDPTHQGRKLAELPWEEIKKIDIGSHKKKGSWKGERPPSLEEVFAAMAKDPSRRVALDYKCIPTSILYPLAKKYGIEKQIYYCSGSHGRIREWCKYVPGGHSVMWFYGGNWRKLDFDDTEECVRREAYMKKCLDSVAATGYADLDLVQLIVNIEAKPGAPMRFCPSADFIKAEVNRIRAAGKKPIVNVWTAGDKLEAYKAISEMGVEFFGTDYPDVLVKYLETK